MELGQECWAQSTPAMEAIHILTDRELGMSCLMQLDNGHVGGGGEGLQYGDDVLTLTRGSLGL